MCFSLFFIVFLQETWTKMKPWVENKQKDRFSSYVYEQKEQKKTQRGTKGKKHRDWWQKKKEQEQLALTWQAPPGWQPPQWVPPCTC